MIKKYEVYGSLGVFSAFTIIEADTPESAVESAWFYVKKYFEPDTQPGDVFWEVKEIEETEE